MTQEYICSMADETWIGSIQIINSSFPTELILTGRGQQFHVIFGEHQNGYYAVIPEWKIGCEMAYPSDIFWNRSSLISAGLDRYEAETVSRGISQLTL